MEVEIAKKKLEERAAEIEVEKTGYEEDLKGLKRHLMLEKKIWHYLIQNLAT